jgi:hypothetical protein
MCGVASDDSASQGRCKPSPPPTVSTTSLGGRPGPTSTATKSPRSPVLTSASTPALLADDVLAARMRSMEDDAGPDPRPPEPVALSAAAAAAAADADRCRAGPSLPNFTGDRMPSWNSGSAHWLEGSRATCGVVNSCAGVCPKCEIWASMAARPRPRPRPRHTHAHEQRKRRESTELTWPLPAPINTPSLHSQQGRQGTYPPVAPHPPPAQGRCCSRR